MVNTTTYSRKHRRHPQNPAEDTQDDERLSSTRKRPRKIFDSKPTEPPLKKAKAASEVDICAFYSPDITFFISSTVQ
ncbi:hypothetical protein M413DRAFT_442782 [Hebeloma cylindrosporum]|uniref:Uncharacterized protein n=1 Tax=Hebeloma cylindrosporum TaxID=76867 RepID=A0A0C3CL10_HEBCY|nr:hypothetical protein M413DRAFT_442782 [Hebeloma cylindrosporum h7]